MNLKEAYEILELPPTATSDEAKKKFKKLAAKFHPDVNKSPDAEAKFKKINEAYQRVESGTDANPQSGMNWSNPWGNPFGNANIHDPFASFFRSAAKQQHSTTNVEIRHTISFKESVQGCKKEISYSRQIKCPHCQGSGDKPSNNGCKKCGGKGQITNRSQGAIYIQTCPDCHGKRQPNPCTDCNSTGTATTDTSLHVSIPAGIIDGNALRIQGMGNFSGSLMGLQDQYTDMLLHLKVIPDPDMRLSGKDVVSELNISLLDALQGCDKNVRTIDGDKIISLSKITKNKDEVVLSVGDHSKIKHRIIINVEYPTNLNKLIDVLLEEGK